MTEATDELKLQLSNLQVTMADGRVFYVQTINPDYVRMDITFAREKYPSMEAAPFLGLTFLAWSAAKRLGKYEGKWEEWMETDCHQVVDEDSVEVGPTQPAPGSGSASVLPPSTAAGPSTGSQPTLP